MSKISDPELLKQLNAGASGPATGLQRVQGGWELGDPVDLLHGISQGLIDPVEGIVQLAEKSSGWKLAPDSVKNWARNYREGARRTMLGVGGEVAGNIAPALFPGGAAVSRLGSLARWGGRGWLPALADAAARGAVAGGTQPVSGGGDFWRQKANQVAGGAVGGMAGPTLGGAAGRIAPWITRHTPGVPAWVSHMMHLPTAPVSALGAVARQMQPKGYGKLEGMAYGGKPITTPSGRLYVSPQRDTPDKPPPADTPPPSRDTSGDQSASTSFTERYGRFRLPGEQESSDADQR